MVLVWLARPKGYIKGKMGGRGRDEEGEIEEGQKRKGVPGDSFYPLSLS